MKILWAPVSANHNEVILSVTLESKIYITTCTWYGSHGGGDSPVMEKLGDSAGILVVKLELNP